MRLLKRPVIYEEDHHIMSKNCQTIRANGIRLGTMIGLVIFICLSSFVPARAQKKPPILSDSEISAFNKQHIKDLQTIAGGADANAAKLARNKLIAITVEQVDTAFNDYRKKSRKRTDSLNFLFDFLEIGASSAVSIAKGERPRQLIGEFLSLFQGSRSAFNKDFRFLERQILFNKMVAKRSDTLTAIYAKLNKDTVEYPWEQARSELRNYFFAGTIDEALNSLSADTGAEAQTSEAALIKAKEDAGIVGAVSQRQFDESASNAEMIDALDLAKGKVVFAAVQGDPTLAPLLANLATRRGVQPSLKVLIETSLSRISAGTATSDDYHLVLLQLNGAATDILPRDPRPNDRLSSILKANR